MRRHSHFGCFLAAALLLAAFVTAQPATNSTGGASATSSSVGGTTAVTAVANTGNGTATVNNTGAAVQPLALRGDPRQNTGPGEDNGQPDVYQPGVVGGVTVRPIAPEGGYFRLPPGIPVHLLTAAQHALIAYVEKFYHIQQLIAQTKLNTITRYRHLELHWVRTVSALQGRWFTAGLPGPFLRPAVPIPAFPAHLPATALTIRQEYQNLKAHIAQQWIQIGIDWANQFRHIVNSWDTHHLHARTAWFHLVGAAIPYPPDALKSTAYHLSEKQYAAEAKMPCPTCDDDPRFQQ